MKQGRILAPFTPEQVEQLNRYQQLAVMHPFTCGGGSCSGIALVAREDGWYCPRCSYTQNWAHEWMADKEILDRLEEHAREWGAWADRRGG